MVQEMLGKGYIEHPMLKKNALEKRIYQEMIVASAIKKNIVCVLPTGLGKTAIAVALAAQKLQNSPSSKILMLSPTKPLVEQHLKTLKNMIELPEDSFNLVTGQILPKKRNDLWKSSKILCATPQVVQNDIISSRINLEEFSLIIFDECHRTVKDYAYVYIAEQYFKKSSQPHVLGLTASPGANEEKIKEIAQNLYIDGFEIRTESDSDVRPYIQKKEVNWIKVPLTPHFQKLQGYLNEVYKDRLVQLRKMNIIKKLDVRKKHLLILRGHLAAKASSQKDKRSFIGISIISAALKAQHAIELLETQGIYPLYGYLQKLKTDSSKAAKSLLNDPNFSHASAVIGWMYQNNIDHPKLDKLKEILRIKLSEKKAIVFTQYRNTVDLICKEIEKLEGVIPVAFKGQKEGFTQKKQSEIIEQFKEGKYNVIVSTSVAEEGLDIPKVDLVIFYEPIPSEIRTIQRRGRTARQSEGGIYVLIAEKTRDEAYFWSSYHKERTMKGILTSLKLDNDGRRDIETGGVQKSLKEVEAHRKENSILIYIDDREQKIAKHLSNHATIQITRLPVGDVLVSERVAVERKKDEDFVNSIIDGRLFKQLSELKKNFELPILLIEGREFFKRNIHPNAVFGAISSITLDYKIPILWSSDGEETARILLSLAKREQLDNKKSLSLRGQRIGQDEDEIKRFIVAGIPYIDNILSTRLLEKFKSVKGVINATKEDLKEVQGIGESRAKQIRSILEDEYRKKDK